MQKMEQLCICRCNISAACQIRRSQLVTVTYAHDTCVLMTVIVYTMIRRMFQLVSVRGPDIMMPIKSLH